MSFSPNRCLIVGPSWVGDMIMAQSLFMALKQRYPLLKIDVLAPGWSKPIVASMPEVSESIEMPLGHGKIGFAQRYRIGKALRANSYDWAIVLPNSLKSALIPYWAKIPKRTGYVGEMRYGLLNDVRALDKQRLSMTVQRFVALAHDKEAYSPDDYQMPKLQVSDQEIAATMATFDLDHIVKPVLALCPGAEYGPAKRWPEAHFASLAKRVINEGWQVWLLGSDKDIPVAEEIKKLTDSEYCVSLAGKTSLQQVMNLLARADKAVSNDSGLMHIAAAVNTPLVALYGSSDPTFTPPLSANHEILSLGLECSPCFRRECPLGTLACLEGISTDQVYVKVISRA